VVTVQDFNTEHQTATATINYSQTFFQYNQGSQSYQSVPVSYPILVDCPVIVLGGGSASLTFPIAKGDECLVLFNDRDMNNWFNGTPGAQVATPRLHSFSDGLILVGLRSLGNVLSDYDSSRAVLRNADAMVGVSSSKIKIANDTTTLLAVINGLITAINALVITAPPGGGICTVTPISPSPSPGGLLE